MENASSVKNLKKSTTNPIYKTLEFRTSILVQVSEEHVKLVANH